MHNKIGKQPSLNCGEDILTRSILAQGMQRKELCYDRVYFTQELVSRS
jgi:hypothetical protein